MCEGQIHFARMYDGEKRPLPCFHGVRGPEVVRSLLEVEATFEKNLQILKDVKKTILDVKVMNIPVNKSFYRTHGSSVKA